ncbi:MAG: MSMEG_1061 family FMN-dependent PPOX-type flavoprotein [Actinomycetota bacterium]
MGDTVPTDPAPSDPVLRSAADLRDHYRHASGGAVDKVIDRLDEHCVEFLAASPFMVLSSADTDGVCDGSPKGGRPGFVEPLDEHHVAWADLSGNNRLDSFENIVTNPSVALLFLIPGLDETLRINGRASISVDDDLRERVTVDGRPAKVVVIVRVVEAYIHCAKAFRRSELWSPATWSPAGDLPDPRCAIRDHARIDAPIDAIREAYDADVAATLWRPGGDAPTS